MSDLEETIKTKLGPLLEQTIEKSWGIRIPKVEADITDQLTNVQSSIYVPLNLDFHDAKIFFKKEFFKRELRIHLGNISELAKELDIDRRSIHRVVSELNIDIGRLRTEEIREEEIIDQTIRDTLRQYEEIIKPEKMELMYKEVPVLSRNIAKFLPHKGLTWKQVEDIFEKEYIAQILNEFNWVVSLAARRLAIRTETLHRKIKKLGLKNKHI